MASTLAGRSLAATPPTVRVGTLRFGTASWELDAMRRNGFDKAQGLIIDPVEFATAQATQVALQAGRVDMILSDWLWVARQRADGADWTFAPFSSAVGAVVAPASSPIKTVGDLAGKRLGIAGSPLDKSWLILQAYGKRKLGLNLDTAVTKSFGAPPLLVEELKAGHIDAMLTFWPFAAKAEAAGMRSILTVDEAIHGLGFDTKIPFVGYVFSSAWGARNRPAVDSFLTAARQAGERLDKSDAEWETMKPLMGVANDAEFERLKEAYRQGIVRQWGDAERAETVKLYQILAEIGGPALVGPSPTLPPGTFW